MRADGQGFVMWKRTATEVRLHQRRGVRTTTETLFHRSEAIQDFAPCQEASFPWPVARGQGLSIFGERRKLEMGPTKSLTDKRTIKMASEMGPTKNSSQTNEL